MPELDYVLLSFVIAIIIIAVLILSCWKNKNRLGNLHPRYNNGGKHQRQHQENEENDDGEDNRYVDRPVKNTQPVVVREDSGDMGRSLASGGYSYFGTAQNNRNYNNRADDVVLNMRGYDSYNDVVRFMGLEPSVYSSHNQWTQDMNHVTSGASMQSERDDLGDLPITWIGLRRPNYTDHNGIEASARQDVSFSKDQMPVYRHYQL
jgi:hypothetical protein